MKFSKAGKAAVVFAATLVICGLMLAIRGRVAPYSYGIKSDGLSVKKTDTGIKYSLKAFYDTTDSKISMKSIELLKETKASSDELLSALKKDGKLLSKSGTSAVFQRFDISLERPCNKKSVQLVWDGLLNRNLNIFVWDYRAKRWTRHMANLTRNPDNISAKLDLDMNWFYEGTAHIIIGSEGKAAVTPEVPTPKEYDYTISWLTDTQYYSSRFPKIFDSITGYIAKEKHHQKIIYAVHTGDLVDSGKDLKQWNAADHSMSLLDKSKVPYGVLAGNHDVSFDALNYTNFCKFFGEERFKNSLYYGESYKNNKNHYDMISAAGNKYIIVYLGWKVDDDSIRWANSILHTHKDKRAILALHSYIANHGTYFDRGQDVMEKVIKPNKNVFMVLCGHFFGTATYTRQIGTRKVYELFFNTQKAPEGGSGYIRQLHFDTMNDVVYVNTYSPYLNKYNYYGKDKDQFVLPLDFMDKDARLETDYIGIK